MTPREGDTVWFYFRHAHGVAEEADGYRIEIFTGMSEMRCRPALVIRVGATDTDPMTTGFVLHMRSGRVEVPPATHLDLEVAFSEDDRIEAPGGVVLRPATTQPGVRPEEGPEPGKLGRGWPQHGRWADRPHPSMKVTAAA